MIIVALMKNNIKKSTISAMSLWRGEGMPYSRPGEEKEEEEEKKQNLLDVLLLLLSKINYGQ